LIVPTNSGLGKGLGALLGNAASETGSTTDFQELTLNSIVPNPHQPRVDFDEGKIEELVASIKKDGLLQPILVRPEGSGYEIVAGERRWQACKRLEMERIPAKVIVVSDAEAQQIALVENLQRDNLNAIEEAKGYKRLLELSGGTQKDLAAAVSKNQATISNSLRLLDLPDEVQDMMMDGLLSAGHGRAILTLSDNEKRIKLAKKAVDEHLSVRETENLARLFGVQGMERAKKAPAPRSYKIVARKLRQQLDTNVKVKAARGKNLIEIEFKDEDDLERIFTRIAPEEADAQSAAPKQSDAEPEVPAHQGFFAPRYMPAAASGARE
jgi:ParB family chromosome partitioning protein